MSLVYNNVHEIRKKERQQSIKVTLILSSMLILVSLLALMMGNTNYSLETVIRVIAGEEVSGATFTILRLRVPRVLAGLFAGAAFGIGGAIFQRMMRNPLASPDILGITSASSMATVYCLIILNLSGQQTSALSIATALIVTISIYALAQVKGFSIDKLVLIGIGTQAVMRSVISYMLLKANVNDMPSVLRWLNGSLDGISLTNTYLLITVIIIGIPVLTFLGKELNVLELGQEMATTLGLQVTKVRMMILVLAVFLIAVATAVTGPIAFVSFLAGPIAIRTRTQSIFIPALVGAVLVMGCDLIGQVVMPYNVPVGVVTGIIGAPYLIFLLVKGKKE